MAIELDSTEVPESELMIGSDTFDIPAGKSLVIETTPSGEEILATDDVPAGKKWETSIHVKIREVDA